LRDLRPQPLGIDVVSRKTLRKPTQEFLIHHQAADLITGHAALSEPPPIVGYRPFLGSLHRASSFRRIIAGYIPG
jgi:hypothetical protein